MSMKVWHHHVVAAQLPLVEPRKIQEIYRTVAPPMYDDDRLVVAIPHEESVVPFPRMHRDKGISQGINPPKTIHSRAGFGCLLKQKAVSALFGSGDKE